MSDRRKRIETQITTELSRIATLGPMLKGTVNEVRRKTKKDGTGERTFHLLTYKGKGNKTKSVYVPVLRVTEAQEMVDRHREATRTLNRVVDLSVDLFKTKPGAPAKREKKR